MKLCRARMRIGDLRQNRFFVSVNAGKERLAGFELLQDVRAKFVLDGAARRSGRVAGSFRNSPSVAGLVVIEGPLNRFELPLYATSGNCCRIGQQGSYARSGQIALIRRRCYSLPCPLPAGFASNMLALCNCGYQSVRRATSRFCRSASERISRSFCRNRHIDRQFRRNVIGERDAALGFKARRILSIKNLMALIAELSTARKRGIDSREILLREIHVALPDRVFRRSVRIKRNAFCPAVRMSERPSSYSFRILTISAEQPIWASFPSCTKTMPKGDCVSMQWRVISPVARLKNVQRHGLAGEEDDVERKQRDARRSHGRSRSNDSRSCKESSRDSGSVDRLRLCGFEALRLRLAA